MPSIFSRIVSGEIPAYKVAETRDYLAFLDINPLAEGHTLVIPKKEVDYIFDLEDEAYVGLCLFAKAVSVGIQKVVPCLRVGIAVVGLEVPHAHMHLVPLQTADDLNFSKPKLELSPQRLEEIAAAIRSSI